MRRKFATNLIFLLTVNLLIKPYWIFGVDRVIQNKFSSGVYGTYFAVFNYSFLLSIILDFGINNFNNRAISRDKKRLGEYLVNLMMVKGALSIIYFAITFVSALLTGFGELQMKMLFFLAVNQVLLSAILYFRSNIAALQLFKTDSLISTLDRLLAIAFCLALLYLPMFKDSFNIMWFIYAQTVSLLITAVVAFLVILGKSKIEINIWKGKFTKMILLKSAPFAMLALLMGIYYRIDAVMIDRMLPNGKAENDVYAAAFRLLDAVNQFGYLFATLLLPMFAGMIRRNASMRHLVKFSSELLFVIAFITALDCYFFRNEIMQMLYPAKATAYWGQIFGWLMCTFIPISTIYVFGTLLTANGSLKLLNFIALGGMFLNIALNLYLIPHYGALGATYATLITQFLAAFAHIIVANRTFGFEFEGMDLLKLSGFVVLSTIVLFMVKMAPVDWRVSLVLASAICCFIAAATRLVPVSEVLGLVRSKGTS
jgi:O-antigen/teichoic acid export membrane protein